jgi:EmrB/QacA subfamily drug resistance transporter
LATTNRPLTVAALLLGMFMAAVELTIVSTAMPSVIADLGGIHHYSWVFTGYLLASTLTVPLYGKLADLYGRKPILLVGIAFFLLGSAASGLSSNMTQLITARVVQGLGAGAMQPVSLTIIGDIFSLEERARMQGLFGAVWGLAGLIGPVLGGLIVKYMSWHWVFFVNVPFGLASAALLIGALHENVEHKRHALDTLGALLLAASVTLLLLGSQGGHGPLPIVGAAVLLAAFIFQERRAREPIVPLGLFRSPVMAVSSAAGVMIGGSMLAMVTYVPLFVQGVLGGSPTMAGSAITPMVVAWPVASALGGRLLPSVGYRPLIWLGLSLSAAAAFALALVTHPSENINALRAASAGFGLGLGFANTALLIAVQTAVGWEQRGIATASTLFFRSIGGALAIGVTGGVLARALGADPSIPADAANRLLGPARGSGLDPAVLQRLGSAMDSGLDRVFWIIFAMAAAALAASLFFPHVPTRPAQDRV